MPPRRRPPSGAVDRPLAIIDIDGVLADVRHRLHHLEARPKDWDGFFAAASEDPAHAEGLELVERLSVDHEIVFLTGRPRWLEADTVEWLTRHGLGGHRLVMRPDRDRRPAALVKVELLGRLVADREVGVLIDDDPLVVEAVARAGFPTQLADWERRRVEDDRALRIAQEESGRT